MSTYDVDDSSTWPAPEELGSIEHLMRAPTTAFDATPVSGVRLLDEIGYLLAEYVVFPSTAALHAVVLWVVRTHALDASESTPRLHIKSAEKRSGKSRLLELVELLAYKPVMTASMSAAALFRTVEAEHPTLLIDEVDTIFGKSRGGDDRNEDLRALLNAGHRRGARVYRCGGPKMEKVMAFDAFAAVALAGIGDLPTTTGDRTIAIPMKRRAPGETVRRFRRRDVAPRDGHSRSPPKCGRRTTSRISARPALRSLTSWTTGRPTGGNPCSPSPMQWAVAGLSGHAPPQLNCRR